MAESETPQEDVFEVDRIRRLVDLMREYDLREIDLRQANQRIRLCRGVDATVPLVGASLPGVPAAFPHRAPAQAVSTPTASEVPRPTVDEAHIVSIKSPMVGTFYSRPNPKAEPYIRVGDLVSPETTVCIIEAMKVFNEIPAEVRGRIVAVLADDEQPVEFGQPLFKVDTGS